MNRLLIVLVVMFLTACATSTETNKWLSGGKAYAVAPAAPPAPHTVERATRNLVSESKVTGIAPEEYEYSYVVTRDFLIRGTAPAANPFNFIYLPKEPVDEATTKKYVRLCQLWRGSFPLSEDVKDQIEIKTNTKLIPFYWLLRYNTTGASCEMLVQAYDYGRAKVIASNMKGFDGTKLQLVSQINNKSITMDLSAMSKAEDFEIAMDVWRNHLCKPYSKDTVIRPYGLYVSAKKVLGVLGSFISIKTT